MHAIMTGLTQRQIVYLHTLKSVNNLSESDYRHLLQDGGGVSSSKDLDQAGLDKVLDLMESIGLDVGSRKRPSSKHTYRKGRATPRQLSYINDMASKVFGEGHEKAFSHWLERYFKVSHEQFLTKEAAQKAIEALKGMVERGYISKGGVV